MNYLKIGILAVIFVFSATFTFAQTEAVPTLYGDKGPVLEPYEEEPVVELISEEEPAPELISEEVDPVAGPIDEEGRGSSMWYWVIAILVITAGALWFNKRDKADTLGS